MARKIKKIFVHCTASRQSWSVDALLKEFRNKGWHYPGYHWVVTADGKYTQLMTEDLPSTSAYMPTCSISRRPTPSVTSVMALDWSAIWKSRSQPCIRPIMESVLQLCASRCTGSSSNDMKIIQERLIFYTLYALEYAKLILFIKKMKRNDMYMRKIM